MSESKFAEFNTRFFYAGCCRGTVDQSGYLAIARQFDEQQSLQVRDGKMTLTGLSVTVPDPNFSHSCLSLPSTPARSHSIDIAESETTSLPDENRLRSDQPGQPINYDPSQNLR